MPDLLESAEAGVVTLTLNRPERLNALSPEMTAGLKEALGRLSTDRDPSAEAWVFISIGRLHRQPARIVATVIILGVTMIELFVIVMICGQVPMTR